MQVEKGSKPERGLGDGLNTNNMNLKGLSQYAVVMGYKQSFIFRLNKFRLIM